LGLLQALAWLRDLNVIFQLGCKPVVDAIVVTSVGLFEFHVTSPFKF